MATAHWRAVLDKGSEGGWQYGDQVNQGDIDARQLGGEGDQQLCAPSQPGGKWAWSPATTRAVKEKTARAFSQRGAAEGEGVMEKGDQSYTNTGVTIGLRDPDS